MNPSKHTFSEYSSVSISRLSGGGPFNGGKETPVADANEILSGRDREGGISRKHQNCKKKTG